MNFHEYLKLSTVSRVSLVLLYLINKFRSDRSSYSFSLSLVNHVPSTGSPQTKFSAFTFFGRNFAIFKTLGLEQYKTSQELQMLSPVTDCWRAKFESKERALVIPNQMISVGSLFALEVQATHDLCHSKSQKKYGAACMFYWPSIPLLTSDTLLYKKSARL